MTKTLLISTYELGHQPFGLASPAAWLKEAGADVACLDLAVEAFDMDLVAQADLIAVYVPMHTATRLAADLLPRLRAINHNAHVCCYGLYAAANEGYLRQQGADTLISGEFEQALLDLYGRVDAGQVSNTSGETTRISVERQQFITPDRTCLPALDSYAHLVLPDGQIRTAGYTEATRGCKHLCEHCPVVPVYGGKFRVVQQDTVLADIAQQVDSGARHITFGDPDFFNGPGHAIPIVEALHASYPELTYDVTIKIEHLLKYDRLLPDLRETGCLFVTSAVESVNDDILECLKKGHTRADFEKVVLLMRDAGLVLHPTFVAFTPWTTPSGYLELLDAIRDLGLVENVSPIQYAIRLLIPAGSLLFESPEVKELVEPFDHRALSYPWAHPDPVMDRLYRRIFELVQNNQLNQGSRKLLYNNIRKEALEVSGAAGSQASGGQSWELASKPVPRMSESWY